MHSSSYETSMPHIPLAAMFPSCPPHRAFQLSMLSSSQVRKPLRGCIGKWEKILEEEILRKEQYTA